MARLSKRENIIQGVKFTLFSISAGVIEAGAFALLHLFNGADLIRAVELHPEPGVHL